MKTIETLSEYVDWCKSNNVIRLLDVEGRLIDRSMRRSVTLKLELRSLDIVDIILYHPDDITLNQLVDMTENKVNTYELEKNK